MSHLISSLLRLKDGRLDALTSRFARWTKPLLTSLPLATLTDLDGQAPKYLIRDNDSKFGSCFARLATASAIEILKTPYHAPRAQCDLQTLFEKRAARMPRPSADLP